MSASADPTAPSSHLSPTSPSTMSEESEALDVIQQLDIPSEQKESLRQLVQQKHKRVLDLLAAKLPPDELREQLVDVAHSLQTPGAVPMQVTSSASSDVSMASASSSTSAADMEVVSRTEELEQIFASALNKMRAHPRVQEVKAACKNLSKTLKSLRTKPQLKKNRQLKFQNFSVKKYYVKIPGALDFLRGVGYQQQGDDKTGSLVIEESQIDSDVIAAAERALDKKIEDVEEKAKAPVVEPKGPRKLCKGGCGFFGDHRNDGYCSKCFKETVLGIKAKNSSSSSQARKEPKLCVKNCGFFGTEEKNGMCNKCWAENKPEVLWRPRFKRATIRLRLISALYRGIKSRRKKKNRCAMTGCRKKLHIAAFECRCGYTFCAIHRNAMKHNCTFNHRQFHQDKLRKANPQFEDEKMSDKV